VCNIMIAMGSLRKKEKLNIDIYHLRKGFNSLTNDHQKLVLKTACGLLRIQRTQKKMAAGNTK
jgi:hypothetical protein